MRYLALEDNCFRYNFENLFQNNLFLAIENSELDNTIFMGECVLSILGHSYRSIGTEEVLQRHISLRCSKQSLEQFLKHNFVKIEVEKKVKWQLHTGRMRRSNTLHCSQSHTCRLSTRRIEHARRLLRVQSRSIIVEK